MSENKTTKARIQTRPPEDVMERLNDPLLGTKLREAVPEGISIPPALETIINTAPLNKRVTILMQILFGFLDDKERKATTQENAAQDAKITETKSASSGAQSKQPKSNVDFTKLT